MYLVIRHLYVCHVPRMTCEAAETLSAEAQLHLSENKDQK